MRAPVDADRIERFMRRVGAEADPGRAYFTGGVTAVLHGWRPTTIDVDVAFLPEQDRVLRMLPRLKDELELNIELVSPEDFVPVPRRWEERSIFIGQEGQIAFLHFDPYSQALAKLERAHAQDLADVRSLVGSGLVEPRQALAFFDEIAPLLYRYPAVDPRAFRRRVEDAFRNG